MLYISKIRMPLNCKTVCDAVYDQQKLHRLLTGLYDCKREEANLLYNAVLTDSEFQVNMYANQAMDRSKLFDFMNLVGERNITEWLESLSNGDVFKFMLKTMPTKHGKNANGKVYRKPLAEPDERTNWVKSKLLAAGCEAHRIIECRAPEVYVGHSSERGGNMSLRPCNYVGVLQVDDADKLRAALANGIGPNKAYGLGMLILNS